MNNLYLKLYGATGKIVLGRHCKLITDLVVYVASCYLMVKKSFDFSISGWLLNNALHQTAVNIYVSISWWILITILFIKLLAMIFELFPIVKHAAVEPEQISGCIQSMNLELLSHITKCESNLVNITQLPEQHSFDVNLRLITEALAEHIRKTISLIKVKRKNLFISIYRYDEGSNLLIYELHYDHKRDLVKSKTINLDSEDYKNYESVKCFELSPPLDCCSTSAKLGARKTAHIGLLPIYFTYRRTRN